MVIKIHLYLLLVLFYMYAIGNLKLFVLSYIFIILHELAHVIVSNILRVKVYEIELLPIGINAKYEKNISVVKELIISLAGPCASFLFYKFLSNPLVKSINLFIAITNLIPFKPYDGGRIVNLIITMICGKDVAKKFSISIQKIALNVILIIAILSVFKFQNYYLAIACIYMICIVKEELKNERFNDLIKYLQID